MKLLLSFFAGMFVSGILWASFINHYPIQLNQPYALTVLTLTPKIESMCIQDENCLDLTSFTSSIERAGFK